MKNTTRILFTLAGLGLLQACSSPAPVVIVPVEVIPEPISSVGSTMTLIEQAHICHDEAETRRLAASSQLRAMARYLAELLPTDQCTIHTVTSEVVVLEESEGYRKVSLESSEVFTFDNYLLPAAATAAQPSPALPATVSCC
ncbi:hypothetical protein [Alkalimonas sp.]|uniref:hypothetical protein n=1 Tax=Alkalimonas sp. TaxID=1872453 RepID=UPI00263B14B2|nr:hypothetical protein [Alkalimonas sp.]MCC5825581.1 hypothetical protein [Alkalimonas sp.]